MAAEATGIAVPVVFLAGVASFLSPCVLPLVPGYLSYMSGRSAASEGGAVAVRTRSLLPATLLFVAGFGVVFVALGLTASVLGQFLFANRQVMTRLAGAVIVLFGLAYLGLIPIPWLYSERRFQARAEGTGGAFVMGLAFGFGWTPCIGPTLGAALTLAAAESTPGRGAILLGVYALGLGVPFVLSAMGVSRLMGAMRWLRRHQQGIVHAGGGILVAVGLLFLFDRVFWLSSLLQRAMTALRLDFWRGL